MPTNVLLIVRIHSCVNISVLMPAYKGLAKIPKTLDFLKFDGEFEIIVAGDLLSREDESFLKNKGVILHTSNERRGKVNALNSASEIAKGELLIFLDSDTCPKDTEFLNEIWKTYKEEKFEIGTGRLMIEGKGFFERSINVEYLFMNSALFMGNVFKKPIPMNGALIIIKKEAFNRIGKFSKMVVEDFDLGYKANKEGLRFFYMKNITVYTASPKKLKDWFIQRKRWLIGGAQSAKKSKSMLKDVRLSTAAFSSYYPITTMSLFSIFILFLVSKINMAYFLSMTAFLTTGMMTIMNRILDWGITAGEGLSYLLWYGPLWSVFTILALFYFTFRHEKPDDWKV